MKYLLGLDIGSSSIKASLLDIESGEEVLNASSPSTELPIAANQPGWAEQDPEVWWAHVVAATKKLREHSGIDLTEVAAIGIAYQMHGLVCIDSNNKPLRPAIIWCDSRAVKIGADAFDAIGHERCLSHFLNSPGNFTASKLRWVKENEPEIFSRIHSILLPGDYIALKLTGLAVTTPSGLSEGILWDFKSESPAKTVIDYYGFPSSIIPEMVPTFAVQGSVSKEAALLLGVSERAVVSYRAGDQPNNAFSLNVLEPGEVAATAGTSGVVYGVGDNAVYDPLSRVNTFLHVNHGQKHPRYGTLLCINGTGIVNSWLRRLVSMNNPQNSVSYETLNKRASAISPGSEGLRVFPYGNGAERSLENLQPGASIENIEFNIHTADHVARGVQEGVVYSLNYGLEIMRGMKIAVRTVRAGYANMFLSPLFREIFATVSGATIELFDTDGAQGAARGAGVGAGIYRSMSEAFRGLKRREVIEPNASLRNRYSDLYHDWVTELERKLSFLR